MKKVAIILPCYNEQSSIRKVVADWQKTIPFADVWLCDNNSTDDSKKTAESLLIKVIEEPKQGKGNAVKKLLKECDSDIYIMCDCDNTYLANIDILLPLLNEDIDITIGNRLHSYFNEKHSFMSVIGNRILPKFVKLLLKIDIRDPLSGLRAFTKEFISGVDIPDGFDIEMAINCHIAKTKARYKNIDIPFQERTGLEYSKINAVKDGYKILKYLLKWRLKNKV